MTESNKLIVRILDGERKAFEELVRQYERLVAQIVFRIIPNRDDGEDICQDVFVKIYEKLDSFRGDCKLSSWIGRIAYNTSINYIQKKKVPLFEDNSQDGETVDSCEGNTIGPDESTQNNDISIRLYQEIDRLPVKYGLVLTLHHMCELGYTEISKMVDLPEGTVKSHIFRARKMLKERLLDRYPMEVSWHTGT